MSQTSQNQIIDEKIINLLKKIEIPKNPISFYLNSTKIEKEIANTIREYFFKAINEFITPDINGDSKTKYGYSSFLFKLYYYSGFTKNLAINLNDFLNILKFYDIQFYLECAIWLDKNIEQKIKDFLPEEKLTTNKQKLIENFTNFLYNQKTSKIKEIIPQLEINISNNPLSYNETKLSFSEFENQKDYKLFKYVLICFAKIVQNYNRDYNQNNLALFEKIENKVKKWQKYNLIRQIISKDKFLAGKEFYTQKEIYKIFNSFSEARKYLITYLINSKNSSLKNFFYFEAIKERLSENEWANLGGTNLFLLQKNNENINEYNMLLFFKNFKDTLIELYNSLFWPFIKPYFYYILVFKAIKLPLKDWQKFFFLLMFFSAESYEEYTILRKIYLDIENIGLWDFSERKNAVIYYIQRSFKLLKIFSSSIILTTLVILIIWLIGLINLPMLIVIGILLGISFVKYIFFPGRFEVLKSLSLITLSILAYIWFTSIFPKITDPKYINYLGNEIKAVVNLDLNQLSTTHKEMIKFIYGEKYQNNEKQFISKLFNTTKNLNNPEIKQIVSKTTNLASNILHQYTDKFIYLKPGEYLKLIIDKEIKKIYPTMPLKDRQKLSKAVVKKYIQYYCSLHKDYYCKTKLEKLPVGFKINLTKIDKFIKELSGNINF